jgi:hypothetical protein
LTSSLSYFKKAALSYRTAAGVEIDLMIETRKQTVTQQSLALAGVNLCRDHGVLRQIIMISFGRPARKAQNTISTRLVEK